MHIYWFTYMYNVHLSKKMENFIFFQTCKFLNLYFVMDGYIYRKQAETVFFIGWITFALHIHCKSNVFRFIRRACIVNAMHLHYNHNAFVIQMPCNCNRFALQLQCMIVLEAAFKRKEW
jgi:hypothetical protein